VGREEHTTRTLNARAMTRRCAASSSSCFRSEDDGRNAAPCTIAVRSSRSRRGRARPQIACDDFAKQRCDHWFSRRWGRPARYPLAASGKRSECGPVHSATSVPAMKPERAMKLETIVVHAATARPDHQVRRVRSTDHVVCLRQRSTARSVRSQGAGEHLHRIMIPPSTCWRSACAMEEHRRPRPRVRQAAITYAIQTIAERRQHRVVGKTLRRHVQPVRTHSAQMVSRCASPTARPKSFAKLIDGARSSCLRVGRQPARKRPDVSALATIAHAGGVPLVVDNTVPTPCLLRPFEHAQISGPFADKYLGVTATHRG